MWPQSTEGQEEEEEEEEEEEDGQEEEEEEEEEEKMDRKKKKKKMDRRKKKKKKKKKKKEFSWSIHWTSNTTSPDSFNKISDLKSFWVETNFMTVVKLCFWQTLYSSVLLVSSAHVVHSSCEVSSDTAWSQDGCWYQVWSVSEWQNTDFLPILTLVTFY